jgi:hypothetical protein
MPGVMTLGSDATGSSFDAALGYVRNKIAAFRLLGTVELPALRQQATNIWMAARDVGETDLATKAQAEFNRITTAQATWETNNDRLESILEPLRAVGVTGLGALPVAAWVVLATIGVAAAMAAAFVFRDQAAVRVAAICVEAVRKGVMSPADCHLLQPPKSSGFFEGIGTTVVLGGLAYWFLIRKRS